MRDDTVRVYVRRYLDSDVAGSSAGGKRDLTRRRGRPAIWVRLVWIPVMRLCYGEYPVAAGRHVSSSQSFGQPFDSGVSYA